MAKLIRKISVGKDYKNDAMHYAVGQEVYGGHTICDILEEEDKYSIYIRKNKDVLPWKDFNKNMAVSVEGASELSRGERRNGVSDWPLWGGKKLATAADYAPRKAQPWASSGSRA